MILLSKFALIFSVVVSSLFALPVLLPSSRSLFARVSVPTGFWLGEYFCASFFSCRSGFGSRRFAFREY